MSFHCKGNTFADINLSFTDADIPQGRTKCLCSPSRQTWPVNPSNYVFNSSLAPLSPRLANLYTVPPETEPLPVHRHQNFLVTHTLPTRQCRQWYFHLYPTLSRSLASIDLFDPSTFVLPCLAALDVHHFTHAF